MIIGYKWNLLLVECVYKTFVNTLTYNYDYQYNSI